ETGNMDMDNYEAGTNYFPVRFRPEVHERYRDEPFTYLDRRRVDIIIVRDPTPAIGTALLTRSYREIYKHGRLAVFAGADLNERRPSVGFPVRLTHRKETQTWTSNGSKAP